ncbi:MAG: hypothetical protein BAJALOKI2v1_380004 [Promethearchaeota archaeon]|nr:MAG: hypothetical protein BAJALOKI2v1_380004 [Candidatus Lokiarchaeota archaeon]
MIEDLFIINEGGQLLYSWHNKKTGEEQNEDDLVSGFLTALNNFASAERGEDIKSLKLRKTSIIFEKCEDFEQKLTFVSTTRNENLIELLHAIVHEIMNAFTEQYKEILNQEFDGDVSRFEPFEENVNQIFLDYGLEQLEDNIAKVEQDNNFKSVIYLESKGGNIYYIHAKQYVNKDKISFLVPLLVNSAKLLYKTNLNENIYWILFNTVRNENLLIEIRKNILIAKQYQLEKNFEEEFLSLSFFESEGKYVKKPKKLVKRFENLKFDERIKQVFLVDMVGKILFSKIFDESYDCAEYIPETISFLTSSKKASKEIYNRILFNSSIGGENIGTVCVNFNNFALILIGNINDFSSFIAIQEITSDLYKQLI